MVKKLLPRLVDALRSLLDSGFVNGTGVSKADSFINYQSRSRLNLEHTLTSAVPVKLRLRESG
jgi:hypothetical protein